MLRKLPLAYRRGLEQAIDEISARNLLQLLWTISAAVDRQGTARQAAQAFEAGLIQRAFASDPETGAKAMHAACCR